MLSSCSASLRVSAVPDRHRASHGGPGLPGGLPDRHRTIDGVDEVDPYRQSDGIFAGVCSVQPTDHPHSFDQTDQHDRVGALLHELRNHGAADERDRLDDAPTLAAQAADAVAPAGGTSFDGRELQVLTRNASRDERRLRPRKT